MERVRKWLWAESESLGLIGAKSLKTLARETGLEPAASAVTGRRSNQLSYSRNPRPTARRPETQSEATRYVFAVPKSRRPTDLLGSLRPEGSGSKATRRERRPAGVRTIAPAIGSVRVRQTMVGGERVELPTSSV